MARTAAATEVLEQAQQALREAKVMEGRHQTQPVVVLASPLGISIEQTTAPLAMSVDSLGVPAAPPPHH